LLDKIKCLQKRVHFIRMLEPLLLHFGLKSLTYSQKINGQLVKKVKGQSVNFNSLRASNPPNTSNCLIVDWKTH
jgi:hypothetical protein